MSHICNSGKYQSVQCDQPADHFYIFDDLSFTTRCGGHALRFSVQNEVSEAEYEVVLVMES